MQIVLCEDGPLLVRGPVEMTTSDGRPVDPGRRTIALCRCGRSALKPFCDGSHKTGRFRAPADRAHRLVEEPPAQGAGGVSPDR